MKNNNLRTCIITGKKKDKKDLIRIVRYNNEFKIDDSQEQPGRGAYISKDEKLINQLVEKKFLHKAFKSPVPENIYQEIIKKIKEY